MSEEQYHSASHCKYLIQYHIIWCPKLRFSVLKGNVEDVLKQFYARCGVLWSRGYFVSTVGHISEATVIKYIEEQKSHE
jgi:REP element-mobilizing transposase RayT